MSDRTQRTNDVHWSGGLWDTDEDYTLNIYPTRRTDLAPAEQGNTSMSSDTGAGVLSGLTGSVAGATGLLSGLTPATSGTQGASDVSSSQPAGGNGQPSGLPNGGSSVPYQELLPWVGTGVANRSIDPTSVATLVTSGNLDALKRLFGNNQSALSAALQGLNVQGLSGLSSFTHEQFQRLMGPTPNLATNFNPLGFQSNSFLTGLNLLQQLLSTTQSESAAREAAERDARLVDEMRLALWELNDEVEARFGDKIFPLCADSLLPKMAEEAAQRLRKLLYSFETLLTEQSDHILFGTVHDQLIDYRAFLTSAGVVLRESSRGLTLSELERSALDESCSLVSSWARRCSEVSSRYSEYADRTIDDVRLMRTSWTPYFEKGLDQSLNYSLSSSDVRNPLFFTWVRQDYLQSGHSSVSKLATSFGSGRGRDLRAVQDAAEGEANPQSVATPADGSGVRTQQSGRYQNATQPASSSQGPVGPLQGHLWERYRQVLGQRESGNDYKKVNSIGFLGRWQFGAAALIDLGYVKPGTSTRGLGNNLVWTGKDNIRSKQDFLNSTQVQDSCLLQFTMRNYNALLRMRVIDVSSPVGDVAGYLMAAHLKGPGGARNLRNGRDNRDAYGTSASSYLALGRSITGQPSNEASQAVAASGGNAAAQRAAFVSSTSVRDSRTAGIPQSPAAPRYPYNQVREYEGGHFTEFDSTPGSERINVRHRTGTGYEVYPDGTYKLHVVKNSYEVVIGHKEIQVSGQVQIMAKGNVGIKSDGDVNISAANDLNLVVGGNLNVQVQGNSSQRVAGTSQQNVQGDSAVQVGGFHRVGVTGNVQIDGASANIVSRTTDVNIVSRRGINQTAVGGIQTSAGGDVRTAARGNMVQSAGKSSTTTAGGDMTVSSTGGKTSVSGKSSTAVSAQEGNVNLTGQGLAVNAPIQTAIFSQRSAIAGSIGPAPAQPQTGQAGSNGQQEHNRAQNGSGGSGSSGGSGGTGASAQAAEQTTDPKKLAKIARTFDAITQATEAYGGGEGSDFAYGGGAMERQTSDPETA